MSAISRDDARARADGKRIAHAIVITIAVAFIVASAVQIIPAVFGLQAKPMATSPGSPSGPSERACADGIQALALGLDRASLDAWLEGSLPHWDAAANVEHECAKSRVGLDAWSTLLRLRRAEEDVVLRGLADLAPLRRDVAAYLPPDSR